MKDIILFESYPYFSGNPMALFNALIKYGYAKRYYMFWAIAFDDHKKYAFPTIPFIGAPDTFKKQILSNTRLIIDSNQFVHKIPGTYRIHTRHGCGFKQCYGYYNNIGDVDAIITTSDDMKIIDEKTWPDYCTGKFIITGLPSNDQLFHPSTSAVHQLLKHIGCTKAFNKTIAWLPTFRQHRCGAQNINHKYPYGLPLIASLNDFNQLNEILTNKQILLLIQMHHAQSNNYTHLQSLSNIKFIRQEDKDLYKVTTADILGCSDALITDYSSAYHEYIILNRPIALTTDDLAEYSSTVGFYYNYDEWIRGHKCLTLMELYNFIDNVSQSVDPYYSSRLQSLMKIHKYIDDHSTERVLNYIVKSHML